MLEIQKFLINGGTLQELRQKYHIRYVPCAPLRVVSLNCQLMSPKTEQMVNECRALYLNGEDWSVAFKGMNNFFDYSSIEGKPVFGSLDWESVRAYEKLDGALICIYNYKDTWRIGSRFSPDGGWLAFGVGSSESTLSWKELVIKTIEDKGIKIEDFFNSLNKNIFYSFELCTKENQVGVIYQEDFMKLIAAVDKYTLTEIDIETIDCLLPKASFVNVKNTDELDVLIANKESHELEGFVLCDKYFKRVKYYNPNYLEAMNTFRPSSANEALANLVRIFQVQASYYYLTPEAQALDSAFIIDVDQRIKYADILGDMIDLSSWMNDQIQGDTINNYEFWPEFFDRLKTGDSFIEIIQSFEVDLINQKITEYKNSFAS